MKNNKNILFKFRFLLLWMMEFSIFIVTPLDPHNSHTCNKFLLNKKFLKNLKKNITFSYILEFIITIYNIM
jgi:hypothetical protein